MELRKGADQAIYVWYFQKCEGNPAAILLILKMESTESREHMWRVFIFLKKRVLAISSHLLHHKCWKREWIIMTQELCLL